MGETWDIIFDGDMLVHEAALAAESSMCWEEDVWTTTADFTFAKAHLNKVIEDCVRRFSDPELPQYLVALSSTEMNWRLDIMPTYKANRKDKKKPLLYNALREYLISTGYALLYPRLEADDVIGIHAGPDTVVVSNDKDMQTVPCRWYSPMKDKMIRVSPEDAARFHLFQTLIGDSVDGYSGCPGVGPVAAARVLQEATWNEVVECYNGKGLTESDALTNARVARLLRWDEFDQETGEVTHWSPDGS